MLGQRSQLLLNIPTTGANFEHAWDILVARYDSKRVINNSQLAKLFSIKQITKEDAGELRSLINDTYEAIGALKAMKRPIDNWRPNCQWVSRLCLDSLPIYQQLLFL